jgi:hypothetical protein
MDRDGTNPIEEKVVAAKTTRRVPPTIGDQGLNKPKDKDKAVEEEEDLEDKREVGRQALLLALDAAPQAI